MHLNEILQGVASGKLNVEKARGQIEALYRPGASKATKAQTPKSEPHAQKPERGGESLADDASAAKESLHSAFERLKRSVHVDELIRVSSQLMGQIAESMPQMEDLKENLAHSLQPIGLSPKTAGIESKFSVFRAFQVSEDCNVADNQIVGSQLFSVGFSDTSEVRANKLTAVQFTEVGIARSNLCENVMSLARLSSVTLQEGRMESNRLTRSTLSDLSITESDFTENELTKSEFSQTIINASRLAKNKFASVDFKDCEFDACNLAGFVFENCSFDECVFSGLSIECPADAPFKIANVKASGLNLRNCKTPAALLAALEGKPADKAKGRTPATVPQAEAANAGTQPRQGKSPATGPRANASEPRA